MKTIKLLLAITFLFLAFSCAPIINFHEAQKKVIVIEMLLETEDEALYDEANLSTGMPIIENEAQEHYNLYKDLCKDEVNKEEINEISNKTEVKPIQIGLIKELYCKSLNSRRPPIGGCSMGTCIEAFRDQKFEYPNPIFKIESVSPNNVVTPLTYTELKDHKIKIKFPQKGAMKLKIYNNANASEDLNIRVY